MTFPLTKAAYQHATTIPNKVKPSERPIVIRFTNRKAKIRVLQNARKLRKSTDPNNPNSEPKDSGIYINEHLTSQNNLTAKKARELRRKAKIENTWVKNCKIFIKHKVANGDYKVMMVKQLDDLNVFSD